VKRFVDRGHDIRRTSGEEIRAQIDPVNRNAHFHRLPSSMTKTSTRCDGERIGPMRIESNRWRRNGRCNGHRLDACRPDSHGVDERRIDGAARRECRRGTWHGIVIIAITAIGSVVATSAMHVRRCAWLRTGQRVPGPWPKRLRAAHGTVQLSVTAIEPPLGSAGIGAPAP
jgi:hypothetical protein